MMIIRWWRVQRAYALLRFGLRVKRETPRRALVKLAQVAIEINGFAGEKTPAAILSALVVIESSGAIKPGW